MIPMASMAPLEAEAFLTLTSQMQIAYLETFLKPLALTIKMTKNFSAHFSMVGKIKAKEGLGLTR